ncbi:transposase family protein [Streptomyces sp. NPDC020801]|uniref:transposase family protein n=1 Tax=unclassified Streptomyces TaxID=2593676 RepID=UPI0037B01C8C
MATPAPRSVPTQQHAGDTESLVYQCRLPLSTHTLTYLADLLRRHLKAIRSRWRALPPGRIALIVLAVLRHDQRLADMAGGQRHLRHHSPPLARRADRPAAKAPRLDRALKKIARRGGEVVLIDGTLIPIQHRTAPHRQGEPPKLLRQTPPPRPARPRPDRRARPDDLDMAARPGHTHDITAARRDRILAHLRAAGLGALADLGFLGLDNDGDDPVVVTGFKATRARKLTPGEREANRILTAGRVHVERGFAHLKCLADPHQVPH